ncbi:WD repeat-containing protein 55 homolog [Palaemon carinicauda]|uniref:WD repeat-containing protein 55 homolog n=1 Tax=Palaemon carinicauda TaxID=392227 RepID=UPI0035B6766F
MVWFPEACTLCYDLSTVLLNDDADEDALRAAKSSLRPWVSGFGRNAPTGCPYLLDGDMASRLFPRSSSAAVPSALAAPMIEAIRMAIPLEEDNQLSGDVSTLDINVEPMDEQEDPPESDDSDEEIPPEGIRFPIVTIQGMESGEEENGIEEDNSSIGSNGPDIEDALSEADLTVNEKDTDSDSSVPDTTVEEVFGIKPSIEAHRNCPPGIVCDSSAVDICFHPELELLSAATMDREIIIAVHLYAHRFVGIVGQHKRFGVETISVFNDGIFLASCAMEDGHKKHDKGFNLESSKRRNRCNFFSDVPEKMESDDEGGPVAGPSHTTD